MVENLYEDLEEDSGSWTHINSILTRKLVWSTPTHIDQCVCLTNIIWCSTSSLKCHVMFSKKKKNVNWHPHVLLNCHLNVTCLVVHVILISKVSMDMSISKLCLSIDVHFFLCASFCVSNVKNLWKLCQKYTLRLIRLHITSLIWEV